MNALAEYKHRSIEIALKHSQGIISYDEMVKQWYSAQIECINIQDLQGGDEVEKDDSV